MSPYYELYQCFFASVNLILLISVYLYLVAVLESNNTLISLNYGMHAFR